MKLMRPRKPLAKLSLSLFLTLLFLACGPDLGAQTRRKAAAKQPAGKKTEKAAKDAKKDQRNDTKSNRLAKKTTKDDKRNEKSKQAENKRGDNRTYAKKRDDRAGKPQDKTSAKEDKRQIARDKQDKKDPKRLAELRRIEAERRAAEEARRQAALAEQRRREQAAREALARRIAFERGLRTETENNINNDVTAGENLAVRRAAIDGLGSRAGTVVVMEAKTGKVLTIVNQDWAIRNAFKPCSTIKLVTGVAGLNENVIGDDGHIGNSEGMVLRDALARSNNGYFQRVGSNIGNKKMIEYAKTLGLGEPTGLNASGESGGRLPYGNDNARIYSHGDDFEVTPLQLAVMVSALSNGGQKVVPQIPQARAERAGFRPQLAERVNLPRRTLEGVLPGMLGAAEYGTARRGVDQEMGVAGKTGSCITKGTWIGLFASVAPVEDPKYSVVVITRGQRERGRYAAAVAGRVYEALEDQIKINRDLRAAIRGGETKFDARAAKVTEDDEEDGADDNTVAADAGEAVPAVRDARPILALPVPAVKKMVQKTTMSRPTFKPVVIEFDRSGAGRSDTGASRPRVVKNR